MCHADHFGSLVQLHTYINCQLKLQLQTTKPVDLAHTRHAEGALHVVHLLLDVSALVYVILADAILADAILVYVILVYVILVYVTLADAILASKHLCFQA